MASLFEKFSTLISANLHYLVDQALKGNNMAVIDHYIRQLEDNLDRMVDAAATVGGEVNSIKRKLNEEEQNAVKELVKALQIKADEEEIQGAVFNIARNNNIKPGKFFKTLYKILLGVPQGPRLGPYILAMGRENVIDALKRATKD